jgi:type IV pilus assembly protein PilO
MPKSLKDLPPAVVSLLFAFGGLLLAGVAAYFWVWPLNKTRVDLQRSVDALKAEIQRYQAVEQQRQEYLVRIAALQKKLDQLRMIVPDEQMTDQFVRMAYNASTGTGVNLRTFVAQPQVPRDFYVEMPYATRLDGTYYAMLSFFDKLAHAPRLVSVTNLALGQPQGGGMGAYTVHSSETVGANCVLVTYYNRPQPQPAAAPPKK